MCPTSNEAAFEGTLRNNMMQIARGDLDYENEHPFHIEGGKQISRIATSQLEGLNSQVLW